MVAKKRSAAKAKLKRRRSAKKNPIQAGMDPQRSKLDKVVKPGRTYATKAELALLKRTIEGRAKNLRAPTPKISAEERAIAQSLGIPESLLFKGTAEVKKLNQLKESLRKAKAGASPAQVKLINRSIQKVDDELLRAARSDEGLDKKEQLARYKFLLSNLSKLDEANLAGDGWKEVDIIRNQAEWTSADITEDLIKDLTKQLKGSKGKITKQDLVKELLRKSTTTQIDDLIQKMENPRRKGMAKKRRKKSKAVFGKKRRKSKKGAKVSYKRRKGRRKSKAAKIAAMIAAQAGHKKHGKKRRGYKKHRRAHKRSNPISGGMMKELAMIAAAGAAASLAVGAVGKFAKPLLDKLPSAITGLKIGNVAVGQLAISAAVPAALYYAMKKSRMPFLDKAADVLAVVTAANIGSRLMSAVLPGGMIAGVEPMLMGVEPQLMGSADFGDADFGDADFGRHMGEIQMYGAEPVLMGSGADFGAVEQFSDYGAVQQFSGYGAVQQFSGDEDYAGEDIDGEDFDGESDFGLG